MSYNGSGTFAINSTGQPVVAGTVISSTVFNSLTADLGTGLSTAITKDGQTTTTARILFAAGISSTLATDATSISTGSILTLGGLGVTKAAWIGGLMNVAGAATFQSTIGITGALNATTINASGLVAMAAAATVGTTLAVSGTATMAAINASGTVAMAGAATVGTTLGVTGTSTMAAINASGVITASSGASASALVGDSTNSGGTALNLKNSGTTKTLLGGWNAIISSGSANDTVLSAAGQLGLYSSATQALVANGSAVTIPGTLGVSTGAAVGGATPGAGGLAFPATAVAVADANTLDDYEEGTWTPTFSGGVNVTGTPTFSYGRYTKVGRLVTISCQVNATITTANLLTYPAFSLPITAIANPAVAGSAGCSSNLNSVGYCEVTTSLAYMFFPAASLIPSGAQIFMISITYVAA